MNNLTNTVTKPTDEYLKFVQQSFNTNDFNFESLSKELETLSKEFGPIMDLKAKQAAARAERLREELNRVVVIRDYKKYDKFDKLGNFNLDSAGLIETYKVSEEILKDIQVARDWLDSYKQFKRFYKGLGEIKQNLHGELLLLGKSILGRAIELAPMDTGNLRRSGVLYDFGTYIVIGFTAPYATYVHENLEIKHPVHRNNPNCAGRAKFLEIALQEFFPDRHVWTEIHGYSGVSAKIGINPLYLEYSHYD